MLGPVGAVDYSNQIFCLRVTSSRSTVATLSIRGHT